MVRYIESRATWPRLEGNGGDFVQRRKWFRALEKLDLHPDISYCNKMPQDLRRDTVKLENLLSVAEQIQAFGLGRKTGEIYITNVAPPARINMVDGEIVDAQFGLRSGMEAAVALINLV